MSNHEMKKKRRKWPIILLIILVIMIGTGVTLVLAGRQFAAQTMQSLTTEDAFYGSISVTTEGSGSIEAASTKALVLEYDGKLETIHVERGDQISKGDILAEYDMEALDSVIEAKSAELDSVNQLISTTDDSGSETISAPVTGRVKRIFAAEDDVVTNVVDLHGGLVEISADSKLKIEFTCTDNTISEGDSVTVEFDSYSVTGTIAEIDGLNVRVTIPDDTEYVVDTTAIVRGKSGTKLGEGPLLSNHPFLVQAAYGIIDSVNVTKESYVDAGDTLFRRRDVRYNQTYLDLLTQREELVQELQELKQYQKNPVVVSEYDGYIVSMAAMEGMPYEKDQEFCTIADEGTLHLKVEVDELDIDGVEVGQHADVVFDAFEEETYTGTVKKISGMGNNTGGVTTYTVTIEMAGDARLKDAMSASATIVMDCHENALLVPIDALKSSDGERYVEVVSGESNVKVPVTVGLINNEYAEITSGLAAGDSVVVTARKTNDIFMQMMEQRQEMMMNMQE